MKKDLIKLIFIFFISIFVIGMLPIVQFIWAFMPTKLVTKEEKQHIEYVVNTAFEDNLGLKVKNIEIPTWVSHVSYEYDVKVQLTEGANKILTDKLEEGTFSYYANSDDEPSSILTNLIFSYANSLVIILYFSLFFKINYPNCNAKTKGEQGFDLTMAIFKKLLEIRKMLSCSIK